MNSPGNAIGNPSTSITTYTHATKEETEVDVQVYSEP